MESTMIIITRPLQIPDRHLLINPILYQRIHNGSINLAEKFPSMVVIFRKYDEPVIIKHVAIQFLRRAITPALHPTSTLKISITH